MEEVKPEQSRGMLDGLSPGGHVPPPEPEARSARPYTARVVSVVAQITVAISDENGDALALPTFSSSPIPKADPTRRERTIGRRLDEVLPEAEAAALRAWQEQQHGS